MGSFKGIYKGFSVGSYKGSLGIRMRSLGCSCKGLYKGLGFRVEGLGFIRWVPLKGSIRVSLWVPIRDL